MKINQLGAIIFSISTLSLCNASQAFSAREQPPFSSKDQYLFYISENRDSAWHITGTLDKSGSFNATINGESFIGRNQNSEILAVGSKGSRMTCKYDMPADTGFGSCRMSSGITLRMHFN